MTYHNETAHSIDSTHIRPVTSMSSDEKVAWPSRESNQQPIDGDYGHTGSDVRV